MDSARFEPPKETMRHPIRPQHLILAIAMAFFGFTGGAAASVPVTGSAVSTTAAEAENLSDPAVIATAEDPPAPDPVPTVSTPTLPPVRASAKGTDIEVSNVSAYPNRVQGKVVVQFNSDPNQIYDCSGTMVNSVQRNIVFTAGHCVYDHETSAYPSAMVFIPAYQNGMEPYGEFSAVSVNTTAGWVNTKSFSYDMGVVQLAGTPEDVIGSRGIAFDLNPVNRKFRIYGYPALPEPDYDGERLIRCDAKMLGRDGGGSLAPMAAGPCYMRQGASGGGWITGGGYLNSLTSYVYCDPSDLNPAFCGQDFGPYFSSAAKSLYDSVADTVTPTVRFIKSPRKVTTKRTFNVEMGGTGTTPLTRFSCRLDTNPWTRCFPVTRLRNLTYGRHSLSVRSIDQTGRMSVKVATKNFRVRR